MSSNMDEVEPLYLEMARDLEDIVRDMLPSFEGKESEGNWSLREKNTIKLRRITRGNSPQDFTVAYLAGTKILLDGILKTVNSLRTTVSTNGCHLVQEIAKAAGAGLDNMVEILLQSLVKLCANTKKITAANGDTTVNAVLANVTYNVRVAHHIWLACQDKNVQPRSYATGWLKTILDKYRHHKSALEHAGSLELIEKCLKAGLADRDLKVRASMRPTYWAFARLYPERSELILLALDSKQQKLLLEDGCNPLPRKELEPSTAAAAPKPHALSRSTNSVPPKPSIRETIAAQKRAKLAIKTVPERPGSAESTPSAKFTPAASGIARPATAMSTTMGTLSSAPVRPTRPSRKVERPELKKAVTVEPSTSRRPARTSPTKASEGVLNSPLSAKKIGQNSSKRVQGTKAAKENVGPTTRRHSNPPKPQGDITVSKIPHPHLNSSTTSSKIAPGRERKRSTSPPGREPAGGRPRSKSPPSKVRCTPPGAVKPGSTSPTDTEPARGRPASNSPPNKASSPEAVKLGSNSPSGAAGTKFSSPSESQRRTSESRQRSTSIAVSVTESVHSSHTVERRTSIAASVTESTHSSTAIDPRPSILASGTGSIYPSATSEGKSLLETSSRKEAGDTLKVYEDPTVEASPVAKTFSSVAANVLEELPVNEPTLSRLGLNLPLLADEPESPHYHRKWIDLETSAGRVIMSSEKTSNPYVMRRILESALARLRVNTLDVHGFRKLQALIRDREDIWDDGVKFDELLELLLETLESPNTATAGSSVRAKEQVKTQVLMTIRLLHTNQPQYFAAYYPRALCTVISARKNHNSTSHMVCGLEELAEAIVEKCDPVSCIDAVLDSLHTEKKTPGDGALFTGLYILAALLRVVSEAMQRSKTLPRPLSLPTLSADQHARLGQLAVSCLGDTNADIRRAVMEFALELHDSLREEGEFWRLVSGTNEDQRSLITYYLGRRAKKAAPLGHSPLR